MKLLNLLCKIHGHIKFITFLHDFFIKYLILSNFIILHIINIFLISEQHLYK